MPKVYIVSFRTHDDRRVWEHGGPDFQSRFDKTTAQAQEMKEGGATRCMIPMTVLEALAILESAVLECKKRNVNTTEVREALDSLERYIWPRWLIPQFRHHALEDLTDNHVDREGQQQVLRATFPGIRDAVRELLGVRMDALARKFHETHDIAVSDEIYRLFGEYGKLNEPWVFRP